MSKTSAAPAVPSPAKPPDETPVIRRCGGCNAFDAPPARTEAERGRVVRAGIDPDAGMCRLNPVAVKKHPGDWCRQFQPADPR